MRAGAPGLLWQELTKDECFGLLARQQVGRVAVVDDRGPVVFPVNFVLDRHMVVFRTDEGTKLDAAAGGSRVAFEIDGIDAAARTGWSVVVRGEAVEVTDRKSWRACASCRCSRGHRCQEPLRAHLAFKADRPSDFPGPRPFGPGRLTAA